MSKRLKKRGNFVSPSRFQESSRKTRGLLAATATATSPIDGVSVLRLPPLGAGGVQRLIQVTSPKGQDGHACMASAATSRNSFSVAPLAD